VFPDDIVVGHLDGVIIVPAERVDDVVNDAVEMTAFEDFVIDRVSGGQQTLGLHPRTDEANLEAFSGWRKQNCR
jgi:regulator of RNase E activity RraA